MYEVWYKRNGKLESVVYYTCNAGEARECFYKEYGYHRIISILLAL